MGRLALFLGIFVSSISFATNCYTDCSKRFPKWYQEPDRKRCQVEKAAACMNSSKLPGPVDHSEFDGFYEKTVDRLLSGFQEGGYVISRKKDGSPEHRGDSALWTSIAMAAMPCDEGEELEDALVNTLLDHGGRFLRFNPLPESYIGNETSRDMETGAIFGFAMRARKCPRSREALKSAWKKHRSFVNKTGKLHEGDNWNFVITPGLDFAWEMVGHEFDLNDRPAKARLSVLESAVVINAVTIAKRKESCYPLHLNTLLLITTTKLGMPPTELTKREFCHETRGMNLPLTEWYCGREYRKWLKNYRYNEYEYRHQRCPWENPDGKDNQTPGVDYLILKSLPEWVGG